MNSLNLGDTVRKPVFAGSFYAETKTRLLNQLSQLFGGAASMVDASSNLRALISPHAGYVFSGEVAASAFNQIPENKLYKRVFVLASSHQFHFGGAAPFTKGNYSTPLGKIEVDTRLAKNLIQSSSVFVNKPEVHETEHSLEVQLPFLQYKLKNDFRLVPIIIGTNDLKDVQEIANELEPWFTEENLFVVSTDFSHYPSFEDANTIDATTAEAICANNPENLLETLERNKASRITNLATSLCGYTSVLTLLKLTKSKNVVYKKIEYRNSGHAKDIAEKNRVVGYWAISVFEQKAGKPFQLTKDEQDKLLYLAKESIKNKMKHGKPLVGTGFTKGVLGSAAGAFVSVYIKGELRGCIGNFADPGKTLAKVVQKSATSAINDFRFKPLEENELDELEVEISVLSPMKKIKTTDEIELGRHGIYVKKDLYSGTFLPQVANKTGWNLEKFLGHCSRDKAGLSWDGWKDADVFIYEAFVFKG